VANIALCMTHLYVPSVLYNCPRHHMACSKSSETRVASHINLTQLAVYQTQHTILVYYKIILEFTAYFQVCVNSSDLEIPL
jgi:hypothetical protein